MGKTDKEKNILPVSVRSLTRHGVRTSIPKLVKVSTSGYTLTWYCPGTENRTFADEVRREGAAAVAGGLNLFGCGEKAQYRTAARNCKHDFTMLGRKESDCCEAIQILRNVYGCRHRFSVIDRRTAESAKFMMNAYLAIKSAFCVQLWSTAQQCGASCEKMRELLLPGPRIDPSRIFMFADHPFWRSRCFGGDVPAIAAAYNAPLLDGAAAFNEQMKAQEADRNV